MDEGVSMERAPWIKVDGYGPIPVPRTIEEWLDPDMYVGKNINWYMAQNFNILNYVPPVMINYFYFSDEHRLGLEHLIDVTTGSEWLAVICNSCHHITDHYHQQWLMATMMAKNPYNGEFLVKDMEKNTPEDKALRALRNTIWQLTR